MAMLTQHWRSVLITLLLGLIASSTCVSALADNPEFNTLCSGCHSTTPGLNPGSGYTPIDVSKFTNATIETYIDANMPKGNASACDANCSQRMADFLIPPPSSGPNNPPVADASISQPTVGKVPLKVSFFANGSTDDHGIVSYTWNFGDNSATGTGDFVQHTYSTAGTYTATLTVADVQGLKSTATVKVYAVTTHTPPVINTSKSTNLSGAAPLAAKLDASLSTCTGPCKYFTWGFDDGTNSADGATATHTFKDVGTHTVTISVGDGGDFSDPATFAKANVTVTVTASSRAPTANASKSLNLKGAATLTALFDASLSNCDNNCSNYAWNFGDNQTGSGVTISHPYANPGTYTATLTVTDKSNGKKASTTVQVTVVPAESLTTYVQACQQQLNFVGVPIPDNINCYSGDLFQTAADFDQNASVNDYMGYRKITDQVDMAFACRWLFGDPVTNPLAPISIEMLVHNRSSGNTCFFSAKGFVSGDPALTSSIIRSPTSSVASTFWDSPASVDAKVRCIGCHVSGPYISTPTIAPFLAKNGLLNNGHDTLSNVALADLSTPNKNVKYHAISGTVNGAPGAFSLWDSLKQSYIDPTYLDTNKNGCSLGCHSVGTLSPQGDIGQIQLGLTTILHSPVNQLLEINHAGVMKPYDDWSDYRWINLGIPDGGTESESFAASNAATSTLVPKLFGSENANCAQPKVPNVMEAHVVGSDNVFVITQPSRFAFLPDRLSQFNLKDGLVCLNSDQDPGQKCSDYSVQYQCTNNTSFVKNWVDWPKHPLASDGDHEERNNANPCSSGSTATGIQAFVTLSNGWTYSSVGPNDRLASFSQYGLTCNNADQPDNKCSNYVVRYSSCNTPPQTLANKTLTNENTFLGSKQLTAAANSLVKTQAHNGSWNTQAWTIEPVANTEYVRLRNPGTGVYLNVSSQTDFTAVSTAALNTTWLSEMWLIEPVANSAYVRLKNLWTGKYLTMADPTTITDPALKDYIPIYSQGKNTGWNTQRWLIQ